MLSLFLFSEVLNQMRIVFGILFVTFVLYAFVFSPNSDQEILHKLITNNLQNLDKSIVAVFWAMGLVPFLLGSYLLPERKKFKLPVWPFWIASFFFGAGALLPYLALRNNRGCDFVDYSSSFNSFVSNIFLRLFLVLGIGVLFFWGFHAGSLSAYLQAFKTSRLVNVMSFDFVILIFIIWPYLIWREQKRQSLPL